MWETEDTIWVIAEGWAAKKNGLEEVQKRIEHFKEVKDDRLFEYWTKVGEAVKALQEKEGLKTLH